MKLTSALGKALQIWCAGFCLAVIATLAWLLVFATEVDYLPVASVQFGVMAAVLIWLYSKLGFAARRRDLPITRKYVLGTALLWSLVAAVLTLSRLLPCPDCDDQAPLRFFIAIPILGAIATIHWVFLPSWKPCNEQFADERLTTL